MFGFIKKIFLTGLMFLSSLVSTTPLSCIPLNNQACKVRAEIINVNSDESLFSISVNKCSCSCYKVGCNNINDPYAQLYVPDVVKNINVKVFN